MLIGKYEGTYSELNTSTGNITDYQVLFYSKNGSDSSNSTRIEVLQQPVYESSLDLLQFKSLNQSDNADIPKMLTSVFKTNESLECYGDFKLYSKLINLMQTSHYYYYKSHEVKKDKVDYNSQGAVHTYEALNSSGEIEYRITTINGVPTTIYYRCGNYELELNYSGECKDLQKRKNLPYVSMYQEETAVNPVGLSSYRSLNEIAVFKDIKWLETRKDTYKIVSPDEFPQFVRDIKKAYKKGLAIAFDTETTGTVFNRFAMKTHGRSELVGMCISWRIGEGYYIPLGHLAIENIDLELCLAELKFVLENAHIVTHYGKFDYMVMHSYGITLNIQDDTYIIQYMLSNIDVHENLKLKSMSKRHLGIDQIELSDIFPNASDGDTIKFQILPYEIVKYYGCADADLTLSLFAKLKDFIDLRSRTLYRHEVYFMRVLAETEYYGNQVNIERMLEEREKCIQDIKVLEGYIHAEAGYQFNISSAPMLSELLYTSMNCEVITRTNEGSPSTGVVALKNLSKKYLDTPRKGVTPIISTYKKADGSDNILLTEKDLSSSKYPIVHMILAYKKLVKLNTTFFAGFERDNQDGWLFNFYNQTRALTGRTISNFQQISKTLKHLITEWDGYYMMNLDYSSIELRVMVGVSQEEGVVSDFSNPEADPHRIIGSRLLFKEPEDIDHAERQRMKIANFGVPFDMGGHSLATFLEGYPITMDKVKRAEQLKADYLNSMPKVKRMFQACRDTAQQKGEISTLFGRIGRFPSLVKETDTALIERGRRQAGNLPIQGTAADILKIATNKLHMYKVKHNMDFFITGHIHDELVLIVNKNIHPYKMVEIIKDCMEIDLTEKGFPNIYTGIAVSSNWGEGKNEDIREIPVLLAERMRECSKKGIYPEYDGHPKDFILSEIREYLLGRFEKYFVELGLDLTSRETILNSNFATCVNNFKNMFLTPRAVAYYTVNGREPLPTQAVLLALADVTGISHAEVVEKYNEDNVSGNVNDFVLTTKPEDGTDDIYNDILEDMFALEEEDGEIVQETDYKADVKPNEQVVDVALHILTTFDTITLLTSNTTPRNFQDLLSYLDSQKNDLGIYKVQYLHNNDIIDTGIRVDTIDRDYVYSLLTGREFAV